MMSPLSSPAFSRGRSNSENWSTGSEGPTRVQQELEVMATSSIRDGHPLLDSPWFSRAVGLMICLNTVQVAVAVDSEDAQLQRVLHATDHFFTVAFLIEMVLKLWILRASYFSERWNVVDFFVVWVSVAAFALTRVGHTITGVNLSVVRGLRLLRLLRSIVYVVSKREIVILLEGIGASFGAMFWIGFLLALMIFIGAILCTELIGHADYPIQETCGAPTNKDLFGNLLLSSLTLLNVVLLAEWGELSRLLVENQVYLLPFLLFFVFVTTLGVLNVIVGVIVDRTNEAASDMKRQEEEKLKKERLQRVYRLDELIRGRPELPKDGSISRKDMESLAGDPEFVDCLQNCIDSIDFPYDFHVEDILLMMDRDGDGTLNENELIGGLVRLITNSSFQHACQSQRSRSRIKRMIHDCRREMSDGFAQLDANIALLRKEMLTLGEVRSSVSETPSVEAPNEHLLIFEGAAAVEDLDLHPRASWERLPDQPHQLPQMVTRFQGRGKSAHDASVGKIESRAQRLMGESGDATDVPSTFEVMPKRSPKSLPHGRGGQATACTDGPRTRRCVTKWKVRL